MRNYILFIIDSLNYSHVKSSSIELMPFLSKLKEKGISCENMYSQAPYTEAAVMNLCCGQDVLQDGGYLLRFRNAKKTIFEVMSENGYTTYFNSFQPHFYPSSIRRGVDNIYYNAGYDIEALWPYRLSHYSELYKKKELSEKDYDTLLEILADNFRELQRFTDDIIEDNKSIELIKGNDKNYLAVEVKRVVKEQCDKFNNNPKEYVDAILQEGATHPLFSIPAYIQHNKIKNREITDFVKDEYTHLFRRIQRMNRKLNSRNCKSTERPIKKLGAFIKHPNKASFKDFVKSVLLSEGVIKDYDLFYRIDTDCDWYKNSPSGRKHIDHYINWARKQDKDRPHFACIHIDDIHSQEVFLHTILRTKNY